MTAIKDPATLPHKDLKVDIALDPLEVGDAVAWDIEHVYLPSIAATA